MTTVTIPTPTKAELAELMREIELYLRFWDAVREPL
jgi:hypothetical protein